VVRGFFRPDLFLDYIRYFVLFEQEGDALIKKIAGYHQFHGVREAVRVTLIASATEESARVREERATYGREVVPGSRKAGVFWHTQGSGKSMSMACYAGKLLQQPEMNNPTLVVVTDRNDLDGQLTSNSARRRTSSSRRPSRRRAGRSSAKSYRRGSRAASFSQPSRSSHSPRRKKRIPCYAIAQTW
jgi:type I site-specific restriction-modification system R (restriction) subunit